MVISLALLWLVIILVGDGDHADAFPTEQTWSETCDSLDMVECDTSLFMGIKVLKWRFKGSNNVNFGPKWGSTCELDSNANIVDVGRCFWFTVVIVQNHETRLREIEEWIATQQ